MNPLSKGLGTRVNRNWRAKPSLTLLPKGSGPCRWQIYRSRTVFLGWNQRCRLCICKQTHPCPPVFQDLRPEIRGGSI